MQSASLLSDMESFKAANPGSVLADFVRWYSPRDWIEKEIRNEDNSVTIQGNTLVSKTMSFILLFLYLKG